MKKFTFYCGIFLVCFIAFVVFSHASHSVEINPLNLTINEPNGGKYECPVLQLVQVYDPAHGVWNYQAQCIQAWRRTEPPRVSTPPTRPN